MDTDDTELIKIGARKVSRKEKGGSLHVVIPAGLVKHMQLKEGDQLIFYMDPQDRGYTIAIKSFIRTFPALGTTIALKSLKKRGKRPNAR
jgi:bifunctional DNA-binding transcriptional regulator/antitoxin component of YhaV-PrlF toxin-antitoxin module